MHLTKLSYHPMAGVIANHMCRSMAVADQTETEMNASLAEKYRRFISTLHILRVHLEKCFFFFPLNANILFGNADIYV